MLRTIALLVLPILALATVGASAAEETGNRLETTADLLTLCDQSEASIGNDIRVAQCNGFIVGTGLLYLKLLRAGLIHPWACGPEGTTLDDARLAFVKWAKTHHNLDTSDVTDGFWQAMNETWPCKK